MNENKMNCDICFGECDGKLVIRGTNIKEELIVCGECLNDYAIHNFIELAKKLENSMKLRGQDLEHYIRNYTPKIWRESIETCCFVPPILEEDIILILSGTIPKKLDEWYYKEAIDSWRKEIGEAKE